MKTDVTLYGLEDAIYAKSKTGEAFVEGKFIKVARDIVDCVYLD